MSIFNLNNKSKYFYFFQNRIKSNSLIEFLIYKHIIILLNFDNHEKIIFFCYLYLFIKITQQR